MTIPSPPWSFNTAVKGEFGWGPIWVSHAMNDRGIWGSGGKWISSFSGLSAYTPMSVSLLGKDFGYLDNTLIHDIRFDPTDLADHLVGISAGNTPTTAHVDIVGQTNAGLATATIIQNDTLWPIIRLTADPVNAGSYGQAVVQLTVYDDHGAHVSNLAQYDWM